MTVTRTIIGFAALTAILLLGLDGQARQNATRTGGGGSEIEVLPVHGSIYMLAGAGANITVSVGKDGVLLVDSGRAEMSDKVLAAIRQLQRQVQSKEPPVDLRWGAETRGTLQNSLNPFGPPKPIRYVINTQADPDHTGGNEKLAKSGRTFTGGNVAGDIADAGQGAAILAYENVLNRLSAPTGAQAIVPEGAWPTDTFHQESMKLSHFFNGDGVQILHIPNAHTDGDSIVYFRGSDVIAAGDIFLMTTYPVIDLERGGTINGVIDGLNKILDLVIPEFRMEGGTMVVPGHGRLSDGADVAYYRDMVTIIRDRVQAMIKQGKTLEQVKAARPTADYDPRWGATTGSWTTDKFVEAAYKSLQPAPTSKPAKPPAMTPKPNQPEASDPKNSAVWLASQDAPSVQGSGAAPRGAQPTDVPQSPRAASPIDLTGYWVSLVADDWRWRMVTPPKGDVLYLPVNGEGRRAAEAWDPAKDEAAGEQCKGYGAPGLMHLPGRLHITWDNDATLKVDVDTGTQTRVFHFAAPAPASVEPTWQGYSAAVWEVDGAREGRGRMGARTGGARPMHGSLRVVTTHLRPGYFRKNGVPYSANAILTEYWTTFTDTGTDYLIVTNFLEDARYLAQPYVRSVQYKREPDMRGWHATGCSAK